MHDCDDHEYRRICELLTTPELLILLGQDPSWTLPASASRRNARLVEAQRMLGAEFYSQVPAGERLPRRRHGKECADEKTTQPAAEPAAA